MPRRALVLSLTSSVILAGCNVVGALTGAPTTEQVTVQAPAGILVGDSAQVRASATKSNGVTIPDLTPDAWRSSDPSVISINTHGVMKGLIAGRQATIFADFGGKTGSAIVTVGSDDARLAYALADQPSAASPYSPDASTGFSSSGGTITVTRTSVGQYTVRFAGLGRTPGGHENVQVTGYGGLPVYCKPAPWDASSADLVVQVNCVLRDATTADSKFTILAIGARPFGASTPLGFLFSNGDTGTVILDTAGTARNSGGGTIAVGHSADAAGSYSTLMVGLGPQSGGASGPVGLIVSGSGQGARRCHVDAYDLTAGGTAIGCNTAGGGPGDSQFSLLWFTRGRPGLRYGYAWANNAGSTVGYSPPPDVSANSSGGAITSKRTGTGTYQIVFAGLAHAAGATEGVQVSAFGSPCYCTLASWGNSGANDLVANVTCWDNLAAAANFQFNILIVQ